MARTADDFIMIRVSKQDKETIRKAAESIGCSISSLMLSAAFVQIEALEELKNVNEQK